MLPASLARGPLGLLAQARSLVVALSLAASFAVPAAAQDALLVVVVDGYTYSVRGANVMGATSREPINPTVTERARFAARILDEHILRSEANKVRYSAVSRAMVFADASGPRLTPPWMVGAPAGPDPDDLETTKRRMKEWIATLASNPRQLALSVARMDYIRSARAYRENATIYRKVTVRKEPLIYEEAVKFFGNQELVLRMGDARKLEARLMEENATAALSPRPGTAGRSDGQQSNAPPRPDGTRPDGTQGPAAPRPGPDQTAGPGNNPQGSPDGSQQNGPGSSQAQSPGGPQNQQQAGTPNSEMSDNDPNSTAPDPAQQAAAQVDNVQSHSDIEPAAEKVRDIMEANPDATRNNPALRQYADANESARTEFRRQSDNYRRGEPTTSDNAATGGGPPPRFEFPSWRGAAPIATVPRYAARPAPPRVRQPPPSTRQRVVVGGRQDQRQSTITGPGFTGYDSSYRRVSPERATAIIRTYKSIPGGITLEGTITDLTGVRTAEYVKSANAVILNSDLVYLSPVAPGELADILRAIAANDSMGVSLSSSSSIVYGSLAPQGPIAMNLKLADHFLGGITFANDDFSKGYRFAPGYQAKRPTSSSGGLAVYFNINDYRVEEDPSGEVRRSGARLDITLVPLSGKVGPDGGHTPDYDRINRGDVPPEYVENATHLQDNVGYYARERILRIAFAYGEAAAFARTIKARGVNLEQLARAIDPGSNYMSDMVPGMRPLPPPVVVQAPGPTAALTPPGAGARRTQAAPPARAQAKQRARPPRERVRAARRESGEGDDISRMKAQCRSVVRSLTAAGINDGQGMIAAARTFCNR